MIMQSFDPLLRILDRGAWGHCGRMAPPAHAGAVL